MSGSMFAFRADAREFTPGTASAVPDETSSSLAVPLVPTSPSAPPPTGPSATLETSASKMMSWTKLNPDAPPFVPTPSMGTVSGCRAARPPSPSTAGIIELPRRRMTAADMTSPPPDHTSLHEPPAPHPGLPPYGGDTSYDGSTSTGVGGVPNSYRQPGASEHSASLGEGTGGSEYSYPYVPHHAGAQRPPYRHHHHHHPHHYDSVASQRMGVPDRGSAEMLDAYPMTCMPPSAPLEMTGDPLPHLYAPHPMVYQLNGQYPQRPEFASVAPPGPAQPAFIAGPPPPEPYAMQPVYIPPPKASSPIRRNQPDSISDGPLAENTRLSFNEQQQQQQQQQQLLVPLSGQEMLPPAEEGSLHNAHEQNSSFSSTEIIKRQSRQQPEIPPYQAGGRGRLRREPTDSGGRGGYRGRGDGQYHRARGGSWSHRGKYPEFGSYRDNTVVISEQRGSEDSTNVHTPLGNPPTAPLSPPPPAKTGPSWADRVKQAPSAAVAATSRPPARVTAPESSRGSFEQTRSFPEESRRPTPPVASQSRPPTWGGASRSIHGEHEVVRPLSQSHKQRGRLDGAMKPTGSLSSESSTTSSKLATRAVTSQSLGTTLFESPVVPLQDQQEQPAFSGVDGLEPSVQPTKPGVPLEDASSAMSSGPTTWVGVTKRLATSIPPVTCQPPSRRQLPTESPSTRRKIENAPLPLKVVTDEPPVLRRTGTPGGVVFGTLGEASLTAPDPSSGVVLRAGHNRTGLLPSNAGTVSEAREDEKMPGEAEREASAKSPLERVASPEVTGRLELGDKQELKEQQQEVLEELPMLAGEQAAEVLPDAAAAQQTVVCESSQASAIPQIPLSSDGGDAVVAGSVSVEKFKSTFVVESKETDSNAQISHADKPSQPDDTRQQEVASHIALETQKPQMDDGVSSVSSADIKEADPEGTSTSQRPSDTSSNMSEETGSHKSAKDEEDEVDEEPEDAADHTESNSEEALVSNRVRKDSSVSDADERSQPHDMISQQEGSCAYSIPMLLRIRAAIAPTSEGAGGKFSLPFLLSRKPGGLGVRTSAICVPDSIRKRGAEGGISPQRAAEDVWRMARSSVGSGILNVRQGVGGSSSRRAGALERSSSSRDVRSAEADGWRSGLKPGGAPENSRLARASQITDHAELIQRKLRSILNKLTLEKFDQLYEQIKTAGMENEADVQGLMELICSKAKVQHHFIPMYVRLCSQLNVDLPLMKIISSGTTGSGKETSAFRRLLVDACQSSFEETLEPLIVPEGLSEEDAFEYTLLEKKKMKGNIIFVAELSKKKIIAAKILKSCMELLIKNRGEPQLEALCELMTAAGHHMWSNPKLRAAVDKHMTIVEELLKSESLSVRIRCLLQDIVDDWKSGWKKSTMEKEGPKTLDQIQRQATGDQGVSARMGRLPGSQQLSRIGTSENSKHSRIVDDDFQQVLSKRGLRNTRFSSQRDLARSGTASGSPLGVEMRDGLSELTGGNRSGVFQDRSHMVSFPTSKSVTGLRDMAKPAPPGRAVESFFELKVQPSVTDAPLQRLGASNDTTAAATAAGRSATVSSSEPQAKSELAEFKSEVWVDILSTISSQLPTKGVQCGIAEIKSAMEDTHLTEENLIFLVSHCIFLVADARVQSQPFVADWLIGWRTSDLVSNTVFELGFRDFLEHKFESTKCDAPNLATILTQCIMKKAKEANVLSEDFLRYMEEEIQRLDATC